VSITAAVGHDKQPLSLVRGPAFSRAEYSCRKDITQLSQVVADVFKAAGKVPFDILKEAVSWSNNPNCPLNERPKVSGVFFSFALSGVGEGLTRISRHEDVHHVPKEYVREGFKIRPYRCRIQESCFHLTDEIRLHEPLDITICEATQSVSKDAFEAKSNTGIAGAPLNCCNDFGIIHIALLIF
jgi:hypothetical protein